MNHVLGGREEELGDKGPGSYSPVKIYLSCMVHYRKLESELKHPLSSISEVCKKINANLENHTRVSRKKTNKQLLENAVEFSKTVGVW